MPDPIEPRKPQRLPLIFFPDSKLYEVSHPVDFGPYETVPTGRETYLHPVEREVFAADLIETMNASNGVGLAAIQVGRNLRVFALKDGDRTVVLWNPVWWSLKDSQFATLQEGCLSFPGVFEQVERFDSVQVEYQDTAGKEHREAFTSVAAHVVQHETEHLDGHLFIEHLPIHKRERIRTKMKQRERLTARIDKLMKNNNPSIGALVQAGLAKPRKGFRS